MSHDWTMHIGRSFTGTRIEDTCPCEKAPCGLVDSSNTHPNCTQHPWQRGNTIRQSHQPENCPIQKTKLAPDGAKKEATR
ncbi:hypothetical protein SEA_MUFASA8_74 [Arthrobacter phage Mufasa8]|uniref:Uncharacterized protein n=1 Tax=Arthrobacter phage Mufasa8 TaxID=2656526 RepID=A0A649VNK5_9CAUD|nr:hypothetical protein HYQ08_gp074 [Arthrobacter phage Mufasa8]QGJ93522.1 hypothetical protein SEA_MUFASA8_74 [Arthrobacter phage Mufasa8]